MAQVFDQQPDIEASEEKQEQYDPWEAVEVVWDGGKSSSGYGGELSPQYTCTCKYPDLAGMFCPSLHVSPLSVLADASVSHLQMAPSTGYYVSAGRVEAVNPWELEVDPDFERTEDEIKRDQEAEQRALRAAALAMRRCDSERLLMPLFSPEHVFGAISEESAT